MWGGGRAGRGGGGRPAALSVGQLVSLCTALSILPYVCLYIVHLSQTFVINEFYYEFHALFFLSFFNGVLLFGYKKGCKTQ